MNSITSFCDGLSNVVASKMYVILFLTLDMLQRFKQLVFSTMN